MIHRPNIGFKLSSRPRWWFDLGEDGVKLRYDSRYGRGRIGQLTNLRRYCPLGGEARLSKSWIF